VRTLITGVDADGRSCLVQDADISLSPVPGIEGIVNALLYRTEESPPPARPRGHAPNIDVQLPPGIVRVMVIEHEAHQSKDGPTTATTMHSTDALDIIFVLDGSAIFVLDDGEHPLAAGDCVVTTGVDHALRAGPDGLRSFVVGVGTPPPD
jgi:hypothetical protein